MNTWVGLPGAANFVRSMLSGGDDAATADAPSDGRFDYARDAAITSYRNRFGRPPSDAELLDSMPHFMTLADQEAFAEARGAGAPILARGFPVRPLGRPVRPPSLRPSPVVPPVTPAPGSDSSQASDLHPYLDAVLKSGRALVGAYMMPAALIGTMMRQRGNPEAPTDLSLLEGPVRAGVEALRAQVAAYDRYKTDPRKSYQTYTKERLDLGPCLYSDKPDPNTPCYYAGWTGNIFEPYDNVARRDAAQYPYPIYHEAELDCSTPSWVAARAREQQLIEHLRDLGYSDNVINSIADHVWRPFMKELADQECGHNPLPMPVPR